MTVIQKDFLRTEKSPKCFKFALIGAAGFVAPRHLRAIKATDNELIAAIDPHDSVGVLDSYFPKASFFTEIERFDRHLEKLRRIDNGIDYLTVCSPNYLHDAHVRLGLRLHASVICEKPLVINPWNLDQLVELENEFPGAIYTILQLRCHPELIRLKEELDTRSLSERADVCLTYITRRGAWYGVSWKGSEEKSGGIAMNIGVHFFDLLGWLFGKAHDNRIHLREKSRMAGVVELERARVRWFLSVEEDDLPEKCHSNGGYAYRSLTIDGTEVEFSSGFTDLHTRAYEEIFAGRGNTINDTRPAVELVYGMRHLEVVSGSRNEQHPFLT